MGSIPPSSKPFNLAIVGGGITGLTLAISLLQHGIPFIVYESAAQFGEIGAGVGFGPNAVKTMGLISPMVKAAYNYCRTDKGVGKNKDSVWFNARVGDRRKATAEDGSQGDTFVYKGEKGHRIGDHLFVINYPDLSQIGPVGGVHRAHFLDQLVKLLPPSVARFGKRLVNVTEAVDGSGDAVLHFADGTMAQHTAVLACDGIKSTSRRLLLGPEYDPVFSGKCAYRGLVPMTKASEIIGDEKAMSSQIFFGYYGHLLTFPIEHGRTMNGMSYTLLHLTYCEKLSSLVTYDAQYSGSFCLARIVDSP
jgi:salicylate hydroxylase